jgi:Ca2+-transporting ATPase
MMIRQILVVGILMGFVSLGMGYYYWSKNPTPGYDSSWGTIVFTVLTLSQMGNALAVRSSRDSLFQIGLFTNLAMLGSVALTLVLQLAVIYVPFLQRVFKTTALSWSDLLLCVALSTVVFWAVEGEKWWRRSRN